MPSRAGVLGQCILDEIQLVPKLLEEALEWIARWPKAYNYPLILSLFEGRYGKVLLKVVQDAYMSSAANLAYLGGSLAQIHLHQIGWTGEKIQDSQLYEKITDLLSSKNVIQKAIGALAVEKISYSFYLEEIIPKFLPNSKSWLKSSGDQLVPSLYSEVPYLHFAACRDSPNRE